MSAVPAQQSAPRTIAYAAQGHPSQVADLFPAHRQRPGGSPLLIFVHGGAWRFGSRRMMLHAPSGVHTWREPLRAAGFSVASIDYRLSDQGLFPAQLHDVKAAVRFFRARAEELGIDPERICLLGASAGGHLVQLAAATPDSQDPYLEGPERPGTSSAAACAVSVYGVNDIRCLFSDRIRCGTPGEHPQDDDAELRLLGGPCTADQSSAVGRAWAAAQPVDYQLGLRGPGGQSPVLFLHGTADEVVPWVQSRTGRDALAGSGIATDLRLIQGAGHGDPAVYAAPGVLAEVIDWLRTQLA